MRDISEYDDTFRGFVDFARSDEDFIVSVRRLSTDMAYKSTLITGAYAIRDRFDNATNRRMLLALYTELLGRNTTTISRS